MLSTNRRPPTLAYQRPPASPGLPPAGITDDHRAEKRFRNKYPSKRGRMKTGEADTLVKTTTEMLAAHPELPDLELAREVAKETGRAPRLIKDIIKSARERLCEQAETYVDLHLQAAINAAAEGDAKPAQWALEHIQEGNQRIVEREKVGPGTPSINIGFAIGGMPTPKQVVDATPIELPPAPPVPEADLP